MATKVRLPGAVTVTGNDSSVALRVGMFVIDCVP